MRVPLEDLEVTKGRLGGWVNISYYSPKVNCFPLLGKEDSSKRSTKDLEHLEEDLATLNQLIELVSSLHVVHSSLDDAIKETQISIQRQLNDKQAALDSHPSSIDLVISTQWVPRENKFS